MLSLGKSDICPSQSPLLHLLSTLSTLNPFCLFPFQGIFLLCFLLALPHTPPISTSTFCPLCSSTLKKEPAQFSKVLVSNHHTTWLSNPENHHFYLHCHKNPKSCNKVLKHAPLLMLVLNTVGSRHFILF